MYPLLNYRSSLYILNISPLLDTWLENIFSLSIGFLSILLTVPFAMQKLFQLDVVLLVYFCFCHLCFWCYIQEIIVKTNVMKICPVFSSGSFTVLDLTFKSSVYSELIFVYVE